MNKEMMLKVADAIEREAVGDEEGVGFDMRSWKNTTNCGTTCCVAGWAVSLDLETTTWLGLDTQFRAAKLLGLSHEEAYRLFHAKVGSEPQQYGYVNDRRRFVPNALRWMAANNKIDWREALDYAKENHDRIEECRANAKAP